VKQNQRPSAMWLSIAAALAAVTLAACGDRDRDVIGSTSTPSQSGAASATTAAPTNTAAAGATTPPLPAATTTPAMSAPDREFVMTAASSDNMEVEASRLALERTKSDAVRKFAQQMVDDHTKTGEQLRTIARNAGVTEAMQMNSMHSGDLDKLRGMNGRDFDREYAAQVGVAAHQQAVTLFERAAREATEPQLKSFAEQTLPHLRDHLKQAQALARQVGVPGERLKLANAAGMPEGAAPSAAESKRSSAPKPGG
jgi:putative membrane protein